MVNTGVTFSDDRRILETWLVNGRFPLQFVATGTEEYVALARKGLADQSALLWSRKPASCGRLVRAAASRLSPAHPMPTPPNYSSIGF